MEIQSSPDLLSYLPLRVIHTILELVPIRDAIKTSVLLKKWRYKWTTLPRLAFDYQCLTSSIEDASDETRLKDFINQTLFLHDGPILEFKLNITSMRSCQYTDHWLLCLSRNGIQELNLCLDNDDLDPDFFFRVHSSVYDCQKLTRLYLMHCELPPPPPTFKGFSCLKQLSLIACRVSSNAIESILVNSPLLENVELVCSGDPELRIRAPNLKTLFLVTDSAKICLYTPLLTKMTIVGVDENCYFTIDPLQEESRLCNYTNFVDGFRNLQWLTVSSNFIKCLRIGFESSLAFHHLKTIDICEVSLEDIKERLHVYRLVMGAPNLDLLLLESRHYDSTNDDESEAPQVVDLGWTSNFTFEKLAVVRMFGVQGLPGEMEFIKFLLKCSPMLKKMTVRYSSSVVAEELHKKLSILQKASPTVKIELLD